MRVRNVKIQSHVVHLRTIFFDYFFDHLNPIVPLKFRLYWTILAEIGCAGHYFYFSTDELKLWSCKISEISQSNLNINLIKQLTEKSKFNKIRKSMNSAQKSPNPNSQRQRLKVKWPHLTFFNRISPHFDPNLAQSHLILPHFDSVLPHFDSISPHF